MGLDTEKSVQRTNVKMSCETKNDGWSARLGVDWTALTQAAGRQTTRSRSKECRRLACLGIFGCKRAPEAMEEELPRRKTRDAMQDTMLAQA